MELGLLPTSLKTIVIICDAGLRACTRVYISYERPRIWINERRNEMRESEKRRKLDETDEGESRE